MYKTVDTIITLQCFALVSASEIRPEKRLLPTPYIKRLQHNPASGTHTHTQINTYNNRRGTHGSGSSVVVRARSIYIDVYFIYIIYYYIQSRCARKSI